MAFEMFCIEIPSGGSELKSLNDFLTRHRVVSKREQLVERGGVPYMMVWLEYVPLDGAAANIRQGAPGEGDVERRDVWETLDGEQRESFDKLRQWRRAVAQKEHIKPFVIFTNRQLGDMVLRRVCSAVALKEISDIGDQRQKKYGHRLLPLLQQLFGKAAAEGSTSAVEENDGNGGSLQPVSRGICFLGYKVFPQCLLLTRRSRERFRRKSAALDRKLALGECTQEAYQARMTALTSCVRHADTYRFRGRELMRTAA